MKRLIIAGNWKMNMDISSSITLINELKGKIDRSKLENIEIIVAPSFINLVPVAEAIGGESDIIALSSQNMHTEDKGAYTGEVSPMQLIDAGVSYVIIGHSERRTIFGESNEFIAKKVKKALNENLKPILCIGETLEERENGKTDELLQNQITQCLDLLSKEEISKVFIAYEPIWAIGTGMAATPEMAAETHDKIRSFIISKFSSDVAENIPLLYGGSMNDENAKELLSQDNINGGLIGGAALKAESFASIISDARLVLDS